MAPRSLHRRDRRLPLAAVILSAVVLWLLLHEPEDRAASAPATDGPLVADGGPLEDPSFEGRPTRALGDTPAPVGEAAAAVERTPLDPWPLAGGLLVLDPNGEPVEGVAVHVEASEAWELVARTDDEGRCELAARGGCLTHPRFRPFDFERPPGVEHQVCRLEYGGSIHGRVVGPGAEHTDARVHAIGSWRNEAEFARAVRRGDPRVPRATIDGAGHFRLDGLHPRAFYEVAASAPARIGSVEKAYAGTFESPREVRLALSDAFGAHLVFESTRSEEGAFSFSPITTPAWRFQLPPQAEASDFVLDRVGTFGLPIPPARQPNDRCLHEWILFTSNRALGSRLGPETFYLEVLGHEPLSGSIDFERLDHSPAEQRFTVRSNGEDLGALELVATGQLDLPPPAARGSGGVLLRLNGKSRKHVLSLGSALPPRRLLDSLSAGDYEVQLQLGDMGAQVPTQPRSVRIEKGRTARVEVDLSGLGAIELELLDVDGSPFHGRVSVVVWDPSGQALAPLASADAFFHGPPYVFRYLVPGHYQLRLSTPVSQPHRDPRADPPDSIEVRAGVKTDVRLHFERDPLVY